MKKEKKYSGVVIPAVTPLTADYRLDHDGVEKIFENFRKNKVTPFILGTTGEAASLPFSLKKEFFELAGRLKKTGEVLYGGISANVFAESVAMAKHAFDNGTDVVVTTLPSYYALTEDAMLHYFEKLANAVDGPMMIYNIPATTHMSIPLHVVDRLSRHDNIVGLKDSERNEDRLNESIALWSGREDFSYLLGWAAKSAHAILNGGDGLVPSTGNFVPKLYMDLYKAAHDGNDDKLNLYQHFSDLSGELYQKGKTLAESLWALKVVMKEMSLCETFVMPPLFPQSKEIEKKIQDNYFELMYNQGVNFNP